MKRLTAKLGILAATILLALGVAAAQEAPRTKVDPKINEEFQKKGAVENFAKRFESDDREIFARRAEILDALQLKPGMAVADVGAGTGLFTRLFAEKVGPEGKVVAVDVSKQMLEHIAKDAEKQGMKQIKTVLGTQETTNLKPDSADLVFLSEVYHHLENYDEMLASMYQALKPGGALVVIDFQRVEGKSRDFVLKHVRAGEEQVREEIRAAGFEPAEGPTPKLKENYFARFRKPAQTRP